MIRFVAALLVLCAVSTASAQSSATLDRFAAAPTPDDDFNISRPSDAGHVRLGGQIHLDYANDPLVYETMRGSASSESGAVVSDQLNLTVGLSLGLWHHVLVFAGVPIAAVMNGDDALATSGLTADGAGLGDIYFGARVALGLANDRLLLGLQATVTAPTSGDARFRGEASPSVHPQLLVEVRPGANARLVLNVGARVRDDTSGAGTNLRFSDELTFGLGFGIPVWTMSNDDETHLDVLVQGYGSSGFRGFFERDATPFEATAGLKLFHRVGIVTGLAAGPGLTRGFGSPDVRVVAMIGYRTPAEERVATPVVGDQDGDGLRDDQDRCPTDREDLDGFEDEDGCPDLDDDGDGIADAQDQCFASREDLDGFQDEDGCPDLDDDGDGVADADDQCLTEREDVDGHQDGDGCPDPDNDGDGVPDASDVCANEAGPESNRGCPDPDRDQDGVVDRFDNCPDEAGSAEHQGCVAPQQVVIESGQLRILDVVYFRTNRATIQPRSFPLLQNVATVLNAHPEIARVRVEGHTDSRGARARNVELSRARAQAVMRHLVDHGWVDPTRLEAEGYGPDRPLVPDARSRDDHARNRRVEFRILTEADAPVTPANQPTSDTIDP